jgi:hypothetical protein
MEITADRVRVGHSIDGARVVWARPLPDGRSLVIAVQEPEGSPGADRPARMRVYRMDDVIVVDDPPRWRA